MSLNLKAGRPSQSPSAKEKERLLAELADKKKPIRLNLDLDPDLHKALKVRAAQNEETVADIVRRLIDDYLSK